MVIITAFQAEDDSSILLSRSRFKFPNQDWNNNYSSFYEPDLDNQLTAIALQDDGRMFKKLKLVGNY